MTKPETKLELHARVGLWARSVAYLRDPGVAIWRRLAGLWAVLYVASPIDLVPDFIPLFGWMDDVGVLALVAWFFVREIRQHGKPPARADADADR